MIHIVCSPGSDGARELRNVLQALGARAVRHRQNRAGNPPFRRGDLVVCWGEALGAEKAAAAAAAGARVFNNSPVVGKWEELALLREAGVATPEFSLQSRGADWHPRRSNHIGGHDFLNPPLRGDYYVRKVEVRNEFRIHIFAGASIRTGIKIPREGFPNPHPWVRSYDAGWRLEYGTLCQETIRQAGRDLAKAAVGALGLDFGAVDLARLTSGEWCVFEVNRRPGLEGNTTRVFAQKLKELYDSLEPSQEIRNQNVVQEVQRNRVQHRVEPTRAANPVLPVRRVPEIRIPTIFILPLAPRPEARPQLPIMQVPTPRPVLTPAVAPRRSWTTRKGNIIFRPPRRLRGR